MIRRTCIISQKTTAKSLTARVFYNNMVERCARAEKPKDHKRDKGVGRSQRELDRRLLPRLPVLLCQEDGSAIRPENPGKLALDDRPGARRDKRLRS